MAELGVVIWDAGRLRVNAAFAPWLQALQLTTWAAFEHLEQGEVYRRVGERVTSRLTLGRGGLQRTVFLKRHGRLPWHECWKAWTRFRSPIWGARPEWEALLEFHRLGLPTLTPIACGESAGCSFLMTEALEPAVRLDHWLSSPARSGRTNRRQLAQRLAIMIRRMHDAGWHHQDLYLCHVLQVPAADREELHLIDLGRVRRHSQLRAQHWIVKDLAQLNYSARLVAPSERMYFLKTYLDRKRLRSRDKRLVRSILRKSARIDSHTRKHGL